MRSLLFLIILSVVFGKSPAIMHLEITLITKNHGTIIALDFSKFITAITFLRFALVVIFD